jgi:hypothetical protein
MAAAVSSLAGATALLRTDPAVNLIRARLIVVSTSATTDITVDGATLASYTSRMLRAPGDSGASQTGSTMRMSDTVAGQAAEAQFDLILAGVASGAAITWNVATSGGTHASVEVYSLSDSGGSQLVDRFTLTAATGQFRTDSSRLAAAGTVNVSPQLPHLVIAHYYPWYTLSSWRSPEFADQPAQLYSSDEQADIDRQAAQAASAGIDAFVVSWQGRTNIHNVGQMHMVLAAASKAGIRACVYFETFIVNRTNDASQPTDPEFMIQWLEDTVDQTPAIRPICASTADR